MAELPTILLLNFIHNIYFIVPFFSGLFIVFKKKYIYCINYPVNIINFVIYLPYNFF